LTSATGGDRQRRRGVAEVVDSQRRQPGGGDGRRPDPAAEVVGIDVPAVRRREHEALAAASGPVPQMLVEAVDDDRRQRHRPHARAGLRRLDRPASVLVASELLDDPEVAMEQVDAVAAYTGHLAEAQSAVGADEDERPVAHVDGRLELGDVAGSEEAHVLRLDPWRLDPVERVAHQDVVLDGGTEGPLE
jgi:hypothetical protein